MTTFQPAKGKLRPIASALLIQENTKYQANCINFKSLVLVPAKQFKNEQKFA